MSRAEEFDPIDFVASSRFDREQMFAVLQALFQTNIADEPLWLEAGKGPDTFPSCRRNDQVNMRQQFRKCAKCGSIMAMFLCENMFISGLIPSGKRMYFRCEACGKEIKIRSLWRLCLVFFGCLMFCLMFWALYPFENWWLLVFVGLLGLYPLILLGEFLIRMRYPRMKSNDQLLGETDIEGIRGERDVP